MPKMNLPNAHKYFISGSNPSLFSEVSNESTVNYMLVDSVLTPFHGTANDNVFAVLPGEIRKTYKSTKTGIVYLVCGKFFCSQNPDGTIIELFSIPKTQGIIQMDENLNSEIGITTGNAFYVYNYSKGTFTQPGETEGFTLANPNSIVCIDTIFFISDAFTSTVLASQANAGTNFLPREAITFNTKADQISALGAVDRTLFFVGNVVQERWVVTGSPQIINKDNVYLEPYGLYSKQSFANKFNMFAGLFQSREGEVLVKLLTAQSQRLETISSPGIVKKILADGPVVNADMYQIDTNIYYEIVTQTQSFIFSFSAKQWFESTFPLEQVFFQGDTLWGAVGSKLYVITPYENNQVKVRYCAPAFPVASFNRFTVGKASCWYSNKNAEKGDVIMYASKDGVKNIVVDHVYIDGNEYYGLASREFNMDCFQFSFRLETKLNIKWRGFNLELSTNG